MESSKQLTTSLTSNTRVKKLCTDALYHRKVVEDDFSLRGLATTRVAESGDVSPNPVPVTELRKANSFKSILINAPSLKAMYKDPATGNRMCKLAAFQKIIYADWYDLIAVSKTWLTDSTIYRHDRNERVSGGVLLIVKNTLVSHRRNNLDTDLEIICVELSLQCSTNILLSVFYRPPNSITGFIDHFTKFLDSSARIQRGN